MWNSLLDYWREFSFLGVASLPLVGLFFLNSKTVNWTTPLGYFTQLRLFIKKGASSTSQTTSTSSFIEPQGASKNYQLIQVSSPVSTSSSSTAADLLVEYPLTALGKESHWKYCLPTGSKLSSGNTVATSQEITVDCKLDWNRATDPKVQFLLRIGQKFLKLQHQMNLIFLYHWGLENSGKQVETNNQTVDWKKQVLEKCRLNPKDYDLKDFFISTVPISKKCLLTPSKVELTLTTNEAVSQPASTGSSQSLDLESLKKASLRGEIQYSFSNYYGKLHDFSWPKSPTGQENHPIAISLKTPHKPFEFSLDSGSSNGDTKLDFESLWKKYSSRELTLCDFCKQLSSGGGTNVSCCLVTKK